MSEDQPTFVTHLECSMTGERYEPDSVHGLSAAGKPLLVRYDLDALGRALTDAGEALDLHLPLEPVRDHHACVCKIPLVVPGDAEAFAGPLIFYAVPAATRLHATKLATAVSLAFTTD